MPERIAAMIKSKLTPTEHMTDELAMTSRVPLDGGMGGGDAKDFKPTYPNRLPLIKSNKVPGRLWSKAFRRQMKIGSGQDKPYMGVRKKERAQRFSIEVVGMIMAAGDHVDDAKLSQRRGIDDAFSDANM